MAHETDHGATSVTAGRGDVDSQNEPLATDDAREREGRPATRARRDIAETAPAQGRDLGSENDGTRRDWTNKPSLRDIGLLLVRLYGLTLIMHGFHKVMIFDTFRNSLTNFPVGSSNPTLVAVLVILGQLFLGVFVALGLFTRLAAFLISFMMFAIWMIVHVLAAKNGGLVSPQTGGLNGESAVLWVALMLPLVLTGAGRISLDQVLARARRTRSMTPA